MKNKSIIIIASFISLFSCKKDTSNTSSGNERGSLSVEFDNVAGASDLVLNTGTYTNESGENFSVSKLKYYVSNFRFTKTDGTVYEVPQDSSYFLIDEENEDTHEAAFSVPVGTYKTAEFIIGVDSLRSTMDISKRTGVLDPTAEAGDMYWGWNSGYIFFKMEGKSDASPEDGNIMYHIGGFGGYTTPTINNIKTITLDLQPRGVAEVRTTGNANLHLFVDVLKVFDGQTSFSIAGHPMEMFTDFSTVVADNYSHMITHDHTENE